MSDVFYSHVDGLGEPILLLHGGLSDTRVFDGMLAAFDARHEAVTYDRRGHGRTPDGDGDFSYDDMLAEAVELIDRLGGRPMHLVGHSDGANLALVLALHRPDLVLSVAAFSGNTDPSGMVVGEVDYEGLRSLVDYGYSELSPDGADHFPVVVDKIARLWLNEPRLSSDDLARILTPVLVVCADRDMITLEHTIAMFRALPQAQFAIVPGTGHMLIEERPEACARLVLEHIAGLRGA